MTAINRRYAFSEIACVELDRVLRDLVARRDARKVCDLGAGANPVLPLESIRQWELEYLLLDVSAEELARAPAGYRKLRADVSSPTFRPPGTYDVVVTRWVAEHIRRPDHFHRNIFRLLSKGGTAVHLFSTLYSLPFTVNRVLPEGLSARVLDRGPSSRREDEKFAAYYKWCLGPNRRQRERFERIGFQVEQYVGFFGHGYYHRIGFLHALEEWKARKLVQRPIASLTSYALLVLRRPFV